MLVGPAGVVGLEDEVTPRVGRDGRRHPHAVRHDADDFVVQLHVVDVAVIAHVAVGEDSHVLFADVLGEREQPVELVLRNFPGRAGAYPRRGSGRRAVEVCETVLQDDPARRAQHRHLLEQGRHLLLLVQAPGPRGRGHGHRRRRARVVHGLAERVVVDLLCPRGHGRAGGDEVGRQGLDLLPAQAQAHLIERAGELGLRDTARLERVIVDEKLADSYAARENSDLDLPDDVVEAAVVHHPRGSEQGGHRRRHWTLPALA
mmetsp:Transcript_3347/g.9522  ORF Transcript_3347/g.9522 Transcript_3347/m.9522 type:complete len:260 (-) Transcript_3347:11-790(-)